MEIYIWMNDASTSPRGVTEKKWHLLVTWHLCMHIFNTCCVYIYIYIEPVIVNSAKKITIKRAVANGAKPHRREIEDASRD